MILSLIALISFITKVNLNRDWIKNKKATINPSNDDKCFQNVATVALKHEENGKNSQRIPKCKSFINKCN